MESNSQLERILTKIYFIRGKKVIIDKDLALLYGVETKRLKEQVKRNNSRFPEDFIFQLTAEEYNALKSQNATLEKGRGKHSKYLPFAFTQEGIVMLSSVLSSETAIQINIQIMRVFTQLTKTLISNEHLQNKIDTLEETVMTKFKLVDRDIENIFLALRELVRDADSSLKHKIGFFRNEKE